MSCDSDMNHDNVNMHDSDECEHACLSVDAVDDSHRNSEGTSENERGMAEIQAQQCECNSDNNMPNVWDRQACVCPECSGIDKEDNQHHNSERNSENGDGMVEMQSACVCVRPAAVVLDDVLRAAPCGGDVDSCHECGGCACRSDRGVRGEKEWR